MERYYYHGIECYPGTLGVIVERINQILDEGLKNRNEVRDYEDDRYNHVCLYKKNESVDYDNKIEYIKTARAGWIDSQFVIIVSPNIKASKVNVSTSTGFDNDSPYTDLVDEWRSEGDIKPEDIVGVALPLNYINEYISNNKAIDQEDINKLKEELLKLKSKISEKGLILTGSEIKNFTDELDNSLNKKINYNNM